MTIYIIWFKYIQIYIIYTYRLDRSSCTLNVICKSLYMCIYMSKIDAVIRIYKYKFIDFIYTSLE